MPTPDWLSRPLADRAREHRYRFAQGMVFGLPVVALQYLGPLLGGAEAGRWIGLFQALLAGWVVYVSATGMLVEGLLRHGRSIDFPVALLALSVYLTSLISWLGLIFQGRPFGLPPAFHITVAILVVWTGLRWWWLTRQTRHA